MDTKALEQLLEDVKTGGITVETALKKLRSLPFESLEYAHIDHHRAIRCGMPEVIYCPGKTTEQIIEIFSRLAQQKNNVLATRTDEKTYEEIHKQFPRSIFEKDACTIVLRQEEPKEKIGRIALVSAGTADIPIAEEARVTAELLSQNVERIYDVGVAGLHRLLSHCEQLQQANVIIVVAGMEGALASVVGGLVAVPVIAVPTSVGYGTSFAGVAPLLTMLNSCAAGVCVVNIDNGFAAGYIASLINSQTSKTLDKEE